MHFTVLIAVEHFVRMRQVVRLSQYKGAQAHPGLVISSVQGQGLQRIPNILMVAFLLKVLKVL